MPNWFSPKLKSQPDLDRKQQFLAIDIELCKLLNVAIHPNQFVNQWVDTIGFLYAMGRDANYIKTEYENNKIESPDNSEYFDQQIKIVAWLETNCTIDCYATR